MKGGGQLLNTNPWVIVFIILVVGAIALMYIDLKKELRDYQEDVLQQVFDSRQ